MSLLGGVIGSVLGSNQNPFNSGFGSLTGGLFPAGINQLGDNYLNGYINYYYANKLANQQNQRQIDFWNMQNAYNTPKAQMARYAEAGLNPNLIYGQSNTASPIGQAVVGSFSMPNNQVRAGQLDLVRALQLKYTIENMKEQNLNLRAQNALIDSQAAVASQNARRLTLENDWLDVTGASPLESPDFRSLRGLLSNNSMMERFAEFLGTLRGNVDVMLSPRFRQKLGTSSRYESSFGVLRSR